MHPEYLFDHPRAYRKYQTYNPDVSCSSPSVASSSHPRKAAQSQVDGLLNFIKSSWKDLVRSNSDILVIAKDPKWRKKDGEKWRLYISQKEDKAKIEAELRAKNKPEDFDQVEVVALPDGAPGSLGERQGALYLPFPYVVPGGRFVEMYAWDSYFIILGLLRDGEIELAKNMVDNYIYQIEHYGTILNGNRTYYLTRSQLPFFTRAVTILYEKYLPASRESDEWLKIAYEAAKKYYAYWTTGPHQQLRSGGLSKFWDSNASGTPAPEVPRHEIGEDGKNAHELVKEWYRKHYFEGIPDYDIRDYYDYDTDTLTVKFYDNDRSMRESGFDTSRRFGLFGAKVLDIEPVCLNSLLYQMENDMGKICSRWGDQAAVYKWQEKASDRRRYMNMRLWNEKKGLYFDYDTDKERGRNYVFGTTFLPLWVGLASTEQAKRVAENGLKLLATRGGLASSDQVVGDQWDKPYAWAPLQMFAVEGLRRYHLNEQSDRLAINFASMVLDVYLRTGKVFEKYDSVQRNETVKLVFGYPTNEVGFGWTNATFTTFYDLLDESGKKQVRLLDGIGSGHPEYDVSSGSSSGKIGPLFSLPPAQQPPLVASTPDLIAPPFERVVKSLEQWTKDERKRLFDILSQEFEPLKAGTDEGVTPDAKHEELEDDGWAILTDSDSEDGKDTTTQMEQDGARGRRGKVEVGKRLAVLAREMQELSEVFGRMEAF